MPIGRYFSHPISIETKSLEEIREFLCTCQYVSDEELFGKKEHWQPPEEFEQRRKGDCDDFALWTWRQLLALGYDARLVIGIHGRYFTGHAWVLLYLEDEILLVEPLRARLGLVMPQLSTLFYRPIFSVNWQDNRPIFYQHDLSDLKNGQPRKIGWWTVIQVFPEWLITYGWYWITHPNRLARTIFGRFRPLFKTTRIK